MIDSLISEIDSAVNEFSDGLPEIERKTYARLITLTKELSLYSDGSIKNNLTNIKLLGGIKSEIESIVLTKPYIESVKNLLSAYSSVEAIQNEYFSTLTTDFTPKSVLAEVKKQAINDTAELLTENGINAYYVNPIQDILHTNITSGGSYATLTEQLRAEIIGSGDMGGKLSRYAGQVATDSINTYSATYTKQITDDLGLTWFQYVGSLIKTSRPFCVALTKKRYVHVSEIPEIIKGNIDGKKVSLSGLNPNTTKDNFQVLRGGFRCQHQLIPVSEAVVPQELKDQIKSATSA